MPIYTVTWTEKMCCGAKIEADSAEEALEMVKRGQYDDVDSEPFGKGTDYEVEEGETCQGLVQRRKP